MACRLIVGCAFVFAGICMLLGAQNPQRAQDPALSQQENHATPATIQVSPPQQATTQPQTLQVVVLDPAHGGSDTGARGANGVAEKDIVLEFARETELALRAEGFQVVLTRQGDTDPLADDRATIANTQTNAIFISMHVASTGPVDTVRTYTYLFPAKISAAASSTNTAATTPAGALPGFLVWREAQKPFLDQSHKFGDLLQAELTKNFRNSPEASLAAPVYGLCSVAAPAVAVELSSVAANPQQLEAMATPVAQGIARAVAAYKAIYVPEGH